jgi:large subunit ribosomal protein L9
VAEAAKESGQTIERAMVQIDTPIKALGLYPIKIKLHPDVAVKVTINVARSPEEAIVQLQKSEATAKADAKKAEADAEKAAVEAIGEKAPETEEKAAAEKEEAPQKAAKKPRAKKAAKDTEEG